MASSNRIASSFSATRTALFRALPEDVRIAYATAMLLQRTDLDRKVVAFSTDPNDLDRAIRTVLRRKGVENVYPNINWGMQALGIIKRVARKWHLEGEDLLDLISNSVGSLLSGTNIQTGNAWSHGDLGDIIKSFQADGFSEQDAIGRLGHRWHQVATNFASTRNKSLKYEKGVENQDLISLMRQVRTNPDLRIMIQEMATAVRRSLGDEHALVWQLFLQNPGASAKELEQRLPFVPVGQSGPAMTLAEWMNLLYPPPRGGVFETPSASRTRALLKDIKELLATRYPAFAEGFIV